jgi:hypothetical protein
MQNAIAGLEKEVNDFLAFFSQNSLRRTVLPVLGSLNFEEWV